MAYQRRSREQWRRLVEGWSRSGLTQRAYCERHGVSLGSLYRWRAIFGEEETGGRDAAEPLRLLPVELIGAGRDAAAALSLVLSDGVRIEVAADFDAVALKRLLAVLREAA